MFSKNATKIDEIFNVDLPVTTYCQIDCEDFVNFVVFLENMNFINNTFYIFPININLLFSFFCLDYLYMATAVEHHLMWL